MKRIKLSLIIPAYNEEKLIVKTLNRVVGYLKKKKYSWEIIVVDDGSKDKTSKLVKSYNSKKVRLITLKENSGKGAALKEGFLAATGQYHIFTDADLSVEIENIDKLMSYLEGDFDVAIASRRIEGAKIKVHQPWHREKMGQVYTALTSFIMGMDLKDYTCGMKGFTKKASKEIFKRSKIKRWAYDSEILFLAKELGFKIKQAPIVWKNRGDTRVRLKSVIFESFGDLLKVRVNHILGKYNIK
ncbi:glycosyltransferase family 2 protein [Candidatus Woesebacteria bacterium]|nr:glycosyltransferase family 2 protein [Candidatus Woesebacteria bacterium]